MPLRRSPRRPSSAWSSPKTPTHPSNGYEVADGGDDDPNSSIEMISPGRLDFGRDDGESNIQREVSDDGSSSSSSNNNAMSRGVVSARHPDPLKSIGAPPPTSHPGVPEADGADDDDQVVVAVAVTQDDDEVDGNGIIAVVSREDRPHAMVNNAGTPSKISRRSKSSTGNDRATSNKTARRRSLRLQSKAVEQALAPVPDATSNGKSFEGPVASNPSSKRRRSFHVGENASGSRCPVTVDAVAKKRSKRRHSFKVDGILPPTSPSSPPKETHLGENNAPMSYSTTIKTDDGVRPSERMDLDAFPPSEELNPEDQALLLKSPASSFQIGITEDGHAKLVEALEMFARGVVFAPNVSKRRGPAGRRGPGGRKARRKSRRDTFDLSKGRCLVGAPKLKPVGLEVLVDEPMVHGAPASANYVTPRMGGLEVNVGAIIDQMSKTLDGRPKNGDESETSSRESTEELSAAMKNLHTLTSSAIQERMMELFPGRMKHVFKYPCVSARVFASMSIGYEDRADFDPLLPFLLSLVDAEIVSLKSKEESEVCFINKRVCFSGFDYSSTTTVVGAVVGQGGGDLRPSIEALEAVLQQALKLPRAIHHLDGAIRCLRSMAACPKVGNACAETMTGYFPSARFDRAIGYYLQELEDVKKYLTSQCALVGDDHLGVRYRMNDFIGRSIRFHLRELLNTVPEEELTFDVETCEERWGRAIDDRSISSILNFSLERIYELMVDRPEIFVYGARSMPGFFAREASANVQSLSREGLKNMDKSTFEGLSRDIVEARSFLFGARACRFVFHLLSADAVEEHIDAMGGWAAVEAIAGTFYKLNIHKGSENEHFVQLRDVRDLIFMLKDVDGRFEETVSRCECSIKKLWEMLNFSTRSVYINNLKVHLAGEEGEYFPSVVTQ